MPELPDVELYVERLRERVVGVRLERVEIASPFVLRSADPPVRDLVNRSVTEVFRIGKRIVFAFEGDLFAVVHLMISGRFVWKDGPPKTDKLGGKIQLFRFVFQSGVLTLQEASTRKRASLHAVRGRHGLASFHRHGLDPLTAKVSEVTERLRARNRTLKRALTDPATFDGIGNAYSDEILFAARLSPVRLTQALSDEEIVRLATAANDTLVTWRDRLRRDFPGFPAPKDVTAFRPDFATHGRFGQPCPVCAAPIQRIVYAENETNYCARCQNEGRVLADRALSRLLKSDWPRTLEQMVGD